MPLNFPNSPSTNDVHSEGGRSWTWNGTTWVLNVYTGVIPPGSVGTTELANNAVTTAKIAAGAVVEADIATDAVTTDKIANSAVTAAKLAATAAIQPTIVDAKGDLIVGTGADTVARQAVGANGSVLMADSAQTNGVAWSEQSLGYRNVVINGAMQVAQRGTSVASITSSSYNTADRFATQCSTLGTWTQSVETDAPTGSGLRKSLKMLCTTADASPAAGDSLRIDQALEGLNVQQFLKGTASAKQLILSFWVKSNVTGTYIAWLYDDDNNRHVSASYTISASATWEKKTITFPADTTGAFNYDNGRSMIVSFWLGAGSDYTSGTLATTWASFTAANAAVGQTNLAAATNNYWQITGVQLEAGSVATPFEFEDYGTTLAKCQRYYYKTYNESVAPGTNNTAGLLYYTIASNGTNDVMITYPNPVEMRAAPTVSVWTFSGTANNWTYERSGVGPTSVTFTNAYTNQRTLTFYAGVGATWAAVAIYGHLVASAEL